MLGALKGMFSKKEITDEEFLQMWKKSDKTISDFEKYLMMIKENKETIILQEITNIKCKTFDDIKKIIELLSQMNLSQSMSSSKSQKKLFFLFEQMKTFLYLNDNVIQNERLIYFVFSSKYEIFSFLLKIYKDDASNEQLKNFLYSNYFLKDIYLPLLDFYLSKDSKKESEFLLPSLDNLTIIQQNQTIPTFISLSQIYSDFNDENPQAKLNQAWLNLIIYFSQNNIDTVNKLNEYMPTENFEKIESIFSLYQLASSIPNTKLALVDFLANDYNSSFKNLNLVEPFETFQEKTKTLLSIIKANYDTMINVKYLPLAIMKRMIVNKSKYDYIIFLILEIQKCGFYENNILQNCFLKFLLENFSNNLISSLQMAKILDGLKKNFELNNILNQLRNYNELLLCLEESKSNICIMDLIKNEKNTRSDLREKALCDYLFLKSNSFKNNEFDFLDQNYDEIYKIINCINFDAKEQKQIWYFLTLFFETYQNLKKFILNIIMSNHRYHFEKENITNLVKQFLPFASNVSLLEVISKFMAEFKDKIEEPTAAELRKVLKFLSVLKTFSTFKISTSSLEDYNYQNFFDRKNEILEIFLIKKFDFSQSISIRDFLQKKQSQDIKNSLDFSDGDYLYNLFIFFNKYNREESVNEIFQILVEEKAVENLNKCIDVIYNKNFDGDRNKLKKYLGSLGISEFLVENSNEYLDLLAEEIDFDKKCEIKFPFDKGNNNILSLVCLGEIKEEKNLTQKKYSSLEKYQEIYTEFNNLKKEEKNLRNLVELFHQKDNEVEEVNYTYSLHPKLTELLNQKGYINFIKGIKVTSASKIKLYSFLVNNKIIDIKNIIEYENISFQENLDTLQIDTIVDKYKIIFNLYSPKTKEEIDRYLTNPFTSPATVEKIVEKLIEFNLSILKKFNFNNIMFLKHFFKFNFDENDKSISYIKLLDEVSPNIMILPFLTNFEEEIYPKYDQIIARYYSDFLILSNSKYFSKQKNLRLKYISFEIFKSITLANWINFTKLSLLMEKISNVKINVFFIFIVKLTHTYISMSSTMKELTDHGLMGMLNMLYTFDIEIDDIKSLFDDIFFYPHLSYILDSTHSILLLDGNIPKILRGYFRAKEKLTEKLIERYPKIKTNSLFINSHKIFQIKNYILMNVNEGEVKEIYERIFFKDDFNEIQDEVKNNEKIQNEIYNIFTKNLY